MKSKTTMRKMLRRALRLYKASAFVARCVHIMIQLVKFIGEYFS